VYTFLHWLLFIKTNLFIVDADIINLFAPMAFIFIGLLIWLRPRLKLLNLEAKKGNRLMGVVMLAWIAMLAPILIAQDYLITATGKLTPMARISQIDSLPKTKY
jgi:hypothetical protein